MKEFNRLFRCFATSLQNTPWGEIQVKPRFFAYGLCFYWGYVFAKVFKGQCITLTSLNENGEMDCKCPHMIVKVGNLFYDGEYHQGRSTMPQKKEFHNIIHHKTPEDALIFWNKTNYKKQFDITVSRISQNLENSKPKKVPLWKQSMELWKKY